MRSVLLALLLAACGSTEPRATPTVQEPGTIVGEAQLAVGRSVAIASPRALLLELKAPEAMPQRLAAELGAGRTWLHVDRPRGFSFAGRELIAGTEAFRPKTASFLFVQPREGGATPLADPALLRLTGQVERALLASRIETIEDPAGADDFQSIGSTDLRVLLGRGLDALLGCVGSGELDTHHWIRLVDAEGARVDVQTALDAAGKGGLAALSPYRVLVRRRTPGDPVPVHFRVRLEDVLVAAQARLKGSEGTLDWTWEGVWSARLAPPPTALGEDAWPGAAPPLEVRYKEYTQPSGGVSTAFWRTLLAPVALGADVGIAFLEGEGSLVDSVAERQRDR